MCMVKVCYPSSFLHYLLAHVIFVADIMDDDDDEPMSPPPTDAPSGEFAPDTPLSADPTPAHATHRPANETTTAA